MSDERSPIQDKSLDKVKLKTNFLFSCFENFKISKFQILFSFLLINFKYYSA